MLCTTSNGMNLNQLKPNTVRKSQKRIGRGGKRGTYSGSGRKGQKSRAGAGVKPGFRGGDNRIWQLFPKQRGASKKHGNKFPHKKHRFFSLRNDKPTVFNLSFFNQFTEKELIDTKFLHEKGFIPDVKIKIKVLGGGELKKKLNFDGFQFSKSAEKKITKVGGIIK